MILFFAIASTLMLILIIFLVYRALFSGRAKAYQQINRLKDMSEDRKAMVAEEEEERRQMQATKKLSSIPLGKRLLLPLWRKVQKSMQDIAPEGIKEGLEKRLQLTGKQDTWKVTHLVTAWLASTVSFAALLALGVDMADFSFIQYVLWVLMGGILGGVLPFIFLNSIIRERQRLIRRQLPEFLDLLCVSVQAGLSFDGGIARITERMEGPLIDECRRVQRDMQMGQMRRRSLQQMAKRCDVEEVYLFVTAVIQADRLGTSMAKTLTIQADSMRERHRQNVRKASLQAPVKMIFPMVLCILPMLFAIMLLNPIITIIESLSTLGW